MTTGSKVARQCSFKQQWPGQISLRITGCYTTCLVFTSGWRLEFCVGLCPAPVPALKDPVPSGLNLDVFCSLDEPTKTCP